jgi:hypothetical protein
MVINETKPNKATKTSSFAQFKIAEEKNVGSQVQYNWHLNFTF